MYYEEEEFIALGLPILPTRDRDLALSSSYLGPLFSVLPTLQFFLHQPLNPPHIVELSLS
jgi:hypothetical protein